MVDVFISYSRDNKARVALIADAVTRAGYQVWWDAELPPHRSYGDVITEKITTAKAAIVVWSHSSAQSEWVRAEADVARNQKKLIQTAIDDVMPPLPFNQIQYAELGDWQGEEDHSGWRKVKLSLVELCGSRGDAAGPPRAVPIPAAPLPAAAPVESEQAHAPTRKPLFIGALAIAAVLVGLMTWKLIDRPADAPANIAAEGLASEAGGEAPPAERFTLAAVINDPDGFSNIREKPTQASDIVGKVLEGEKFLTYPQSGSWWRVRKADGTSGFMARRLIRVLDGPNPDPVPPPRSSGTIANTGATIVPAAPVITPGPADAGGDAGPGRATVPAGSGYGVIIPGSSRRALTAADIAGLSDIELKLARNEIFARKGMRFKDPRLAAHFAQFDWYRPSSDSVALNAIEKANVALLRDAEAGR
jgi:hypothetical protein